jgi:enediyne biosynthesis protein E4
VKRVRTLFALAVLVPLAQFPDPATRAGLGSSFSNGKSDHTTVVSETNAGPVLPPLEFHNIAAQAGLTRSFPNGGVDSKKYIVETTGSGIAFIDYDNDGFPDLFVLSGPGGSNRLYHNDQKGHFVDVTQEMGLMHSGWAQGVCVGDYDNDGFVDLFVTYWGQNVLYHNRGGHHFDDVTAQAGLNEDGTHYSTGCAFLDYNRDGYLDLFVANYLQFDFATSPKPGQNPYCWYRGMPVACGPRGLPFETNLLYRNRGNGTFEDVSQASGIAKPHQNYSLGVVTGDFNNDGWPDIYVACDRTPSLLYVNQHNGQFSEEALLRGVALDDEGNALSGMGVAAADYEGDGWLDLFRTNFSDEHASLYHNQGAGMFNETTLAAGLGGSTRFVGWGVGFLDFDNDTWPDLFWVSGHIFPEVEHLRTDVHYKDHAILYRNLGDGKFSDVSAQAGAPFAERHSARGAAFADYDNDGSVEIAINNQNEPPSLFKLAEKPHGNWIIFRLEGTRSNRSAIGARVKLTTGARIQMDEVRSGGSYMSQNDLRVRFGLGEATIIDRVEIDWPSGTHEVETKLPANQIVNLREPR